VEGPGYLVFTPFRPAGFDGWIYVNRGYVPQRLKNPDLRPAGQVEGTVVVEGLLRSRQQRQFFDGPNNPTSNVWLLRDPAELSAAASETAASGQGGKRATAFYVEQLAPRPPGGLPVPSDGKYELPNRHLEYALTWWGLALTLIGVYSAWILSRRRRGERVGA
jgi:surfeit locus 1 family protein